MLCFVYAIEYDYDFQSSNSFCGLVALSQKKAGTFKFKFYKGNISNQYCSLTQN